LPRRVSAETSESERSSVTKWCTASRWRAGKLASAPATVRVGVSETPRGVGRLIGTAFKGKRRVHLAHVVATGAAEKINRSPVGDDAQPRRKRSARVVGMPGAMYG
jgi:hypothetical protein